MEEITRYTASDGCEVSLTAEDVVKYIVSSSGNAKPTEKDIMAFIAKCQARGLNPLAGDCYMVTYDSKDGAKSSVITSKDYFVRTACKQPDYDGLEAGIVVANKDGELIYREGSLYGKETERLVGGYAVVYSKTRSHPSRAVVSLSEYSTGRNLWASKPATMIRKVALVQAIREAYPEQFGGVYDNAEMPEPTYEPNAGNN